MTRKVDLPEDVEEDRRNYDTQHWRIGPGTIVAVIVAAVSVVSSFAVMADNIQTIKADRLRDRAEIMEAIKDMSRKIDHLLESRR